MSPQQGDKLDVLIDPSKHFDADMRPYVCISEECGDFPPSFSSRGKWLSHMKETHGASWVQHVHRTQWICQQCPEDSNERKTGFPTKDLLLNHLSKPGGKHQLLDPLDIAMVAAESQRLNPDGADNCPLCSEFSTDKEAEKNIDELYKHLARHLVSIAKLSLQWWKVDSKEDTKEGEECLTGDNVTYYSIDPFPETWENSEKPFLDEILLMGDKRPVQALNSEVNFDYTSPPDSELDLRLLVPFKDLETDWQKLSRHLSKSGGSSDELDTSFNRVRRTVNEYRRILRNSTFEFMDKRDAKKYRWIPISSIHQLFEEHDGIVEALQMDGFELQDDMKRFVFHQAKRLVALLIRFNHLKWLSLFHSNDFGDENFPINFSVDRSSNMWTLQSSKTEKMISFEVTKSEVNGISANDQDSLAAFCDHHQWLIFLPVFSPDDRTHVFDPLCRMPFLKEFEPHVTNFSIVRHFVIHRSHLNFPRDDQIVRLF